MEDCVFCKIVEGKIPCEKVWEDENYLAFLNINPISRGHTLLIPKIHYRWVWEVANFTGYFEAVRTVKEVLDIKYQSKFMEMKIFGADVPHAHIHLIPHYESLTS